MTMFFLTVSGHWEDVLYHLGIVRYERKVDIHIFKEHIHFRSKNFKLHLLYITTNCLRLPSHLLDCLAQLTSAQKENALIET